MAMNRSNVLFGLLVCSLALNLFLAGTLASRVMNRPSQVMAPPPPNIGWIMRELEPDARQALQPQVSQYGESLRPLRGNMFRAQRELNRLLAADPLDREAVMAAFRELRQANMAYQEMSHEQIAALLDALSAEQRVRAFRFMGERRNPMEPGQEGRRRGGAYPDTDSPPRDE